MTDRQQHRVHPVNEVPRPRPEVRIEQLRPVIRALQGPVPTVRIGRAELACVSMSQAVDRVRSLAAGAAPSLVVTANADHIVRLERDESLASAYWAADLSVPDGQPLVWTAKLMSVPAHRVTGVDLLEEICALQDDGLRLFLLGGSERNSTAAARVLRQRYPRLQLVGRNTAWVSESGSDGIIEEITTSGANVVAVFFGCPKQEIWVNEHRDKLPPGAYLCLGGTIDIVSGQLPRAGKMWQTLGLEWLHRLFLEPGRLWRRYLIDDPKFALIACRSIMAARRRGSSASLPDHPGGITGHDAQWRYVTGHYGPSPDDAAPPDPNARQNDGTGPDPHVVLHDDRAVVDITLPVHGDIN